MAPQTRSRTSGGTAQSSIDEVVTRTAPEASSKSSVAKKPKVYRRSAPAPKQLHFPARNKTIRTYGKGKARRSLPSKTGVQSTLTQIGWIPSTYQEDEDDMDGLIDLTMDDEDEAQKAEHRRATRRSSKRRKTTGNLDAIPDSTASSGFHTQTLTQMPSFISGQQSEDDEVDEEFKVDNDEDGQKVVTKMPDSSEKLEDSSSREKKKGSTPSPAKAVSQPPHGTTPSHVAQTPRKQLVEREVIPSSQPSPFTPNLGIGERYWSQMDRTPLKERSTNVDAPTPTISRKRPRTLEVADSWSTVNGGMGSSPSRAKVQRTPLKEITLADVAERSLILGETPVRDNEATATEVLNPEVDSVLRTAPEMGTPEKRKDVSQKSTRSVGDIVLDSEDEFDFELEDDSEANDEAPGTPTPATRAHTPGNTGLAAQETGALVQSLYKSRVIPSKSPATQRNSTPNPQTENDEAQPETPSPSPQRRASISSVVEVDKETPLSSPQKTSPALPSSARIESKHISQAFSARPSPQKGSPAMPPVSQLGFRYKSQAFESQRVPFERIQQLGPQTDRSDIIVSVDHEQAEQIVEGLKSHEFRDYRIPQTVGRIWIYITQPVCALKYMATISGAKQPGEISHEDQGVGNDEFNEGKGLKFAYELKQVYQLNNPVSLARMRENGWVEEAPAKYVYVPPAVLGELMANLRRALFVEPGEPQSSQVDMSESQEVDMQLRSDIAHSTQMGRMGSSPVHSQSRDAADDADIIPSSQVNEREELTSSPPHPTVAATDKPVFAKPAAPASRSQRSVHWVEDSPVGRRAQQGSQRAEGYAVRPSQATTASAPSSPSQRLPSYRGQPILISSQTQPSIPVSPPMKAAAPQMVAQSSGLVSGLEEEDGVVGDSPVRRHRIEPQSSSAPLGSSQAFLALGSGEPDSLLDDSRVRQPPDVVWDSEEEID